MLDRKPDILSYSMWNTFTSKVHCAAGVLRILHVAEYSAGISHDDNNSVECNNVKAVYQVSIKYYVKVCLLH